MVCQIMLFLAQRPCVVNEVADNKLNSMDSVLLDIENVIVWWALQTIAIWLILKPDQHDPSLNALGNKKQPLWPTLTSQS